MAYHIITDINQLSADWLTTILMNNGALLTGHIEDIDVQPFESTNAHLVKISLHYKPGSTGEQPLQLLLKMGNAGSNGFGPSEVHYYARDYIGLKDAPIPKSYDAHYSSEQKKYHILMNDYSATHRNNWNTTPTLAYGSATAQAIATLHAHWWETEFRRKWEFALLKQYHENLIYKGITAYSWHQLVRDYKLCVIQSIYVATAWCVSNAERVNMKWVWLPQLKRAMAAYFDLKCGELWQ